jgi:carbohydrate-selective porin OprB
MNHTTLGLFAVLAAATLVITALAAAPAFAGGHYKGGLGDGNTLTKQKNQGKAIASGFGTTAANIQLNSICFLVTTACV